MAKKKRKTATLKKTVGVAPQPIETPPAPKAETRTDLASQTPNEPRLSLASVEGYVTDGRFEADLKTQISPEYIDGSRFNAKRRAQLVGDIAHLPDADKEAILHLFDLAASGTFRELYLNLWGLGYRLTEFDREELLENFDGQEWMADLAEDAVEIFHDGGLAHFCASSQGIVVFNNEWSWEEPICDSVDVLVWLNLHRCAVEQGTYSPEDYTQTLSSWAIDSYDFELEK